MSRAKRAKKSSLPKKLLLILILVVVIMGMITALDEGLTEAIVGFMGADVKSYDASDFVKQAFTHEDTRYLPIKVGNTNETVSKEDVERDFQKAGLSVKGFSSNTMATGTKVDTNNGSYTILIYGDTNGDGRVNVLDAQAIIKHIVRGGNNTLNGAKKIAANVEEEKKDEINVLDALRIVKFVLGKNPIINSLPTSDLQNDHEAPVLKLNGDEEVTINVSTNERPVEYKDQGATAEDKIDYTVNNKIQVNSNVNVNVPGDYEVRYNVTDSNGNKAKEIKRIVHVVNYIAGIEVDTLPTKVDFAKGEEIKLDGIKVIAIMAYDDGKTTEIPVEELTVTPKIADTDGTTVERKKVTIGYRDLETTIDITVTPHVPIFDIEGTFAERVGLGLTYTAPRVTAKDDETLAPITDIKVTMSSTAPDGTVVNLGECRQEDIGRNLDTSVVGTKYTITYTAVNALGNPGTLTKTVTVVDIIERVIFKDDTLNKVNYLDGDRIDLRGISAEIIWKSNKREEVSYSNLTAYSEDSEEANIAKYNKNNFGTDTSQIITIKYKTKDTVSKENVEFIVGTLPINVQKRLESVVKIEEVSIDVPKEIYSQVLVARVKAGNGEEEIDTSKIDVQIKPKAGETVTSGLETWIKKENSTYNGEKVVDIYCAVSEEAIYEITITPYTANMPGYEPIGTINTAIVHLKSQITAEPNMIVLSPFRMEGVQTQPTRYITGDELVTNVTYYHTYSFEGFNEKNKAVEIKPIYVPDYNINVIMERFDKETAIENTLKIGQDVEYKLLTSDGKDAVQERGELAKIRIKVLKDLNDNEATGTVVGTTLEISRKNSSSQVKVDYQRSVKIYNEPKKVVTFGTAGKTNMTLAMTAHSGSEYTIKQLETGGLYYTMIPISLADQYNSIDILNSMLNQPGGIEVKHVDANGNKTTLVDIVGVYNYGNIYTKASGDDVINCIGIAPQNSITTLAELNKLRNGRIEVTYGTPGKDRVQKYIDTIDVITPPVTSLSVTDKNVRTIVCYTNTVIADVTSSTELNVLKTGIIGINVEHNGRTYKITRPGTYAETNNRFGFTETEENGKVTLSFWTKETGTHKITPYIQGMSVADSGGKTITLEARHDNTVNLIVFNSKYDTDYTGTTTVEVPAGGSSWFKVRYYHRYDEQNVVPVNVQASKVTYEKLSTSANWDIKTCAEGDTLETPADDYADGVKTTIGDSVPNELKFKIKVTNANGVYSSDTITLKVRQVDPKTDVQIGTGKEREVVKVYQDLDGLNATEVAELDNGTLYRLPNGTLIYYDEYNSDFYYTLIRIRQTGNTTESTLLGKYLNTVEDNKENENNVTFIGQDNAGSTMATNTIIMLGFTGEGDNITVAADNDEMTYVGIALSPNSYKVLEDEALEDAEGNFVLMKAEIWYRPEESGSAHKVQQTIYISK